MKKHSARFELHSAGRTFSVAYTNVAGYNCGYTITTPNGSTIRRIVERDEFRRNLVTNCATCFNGSPTYWYSTDYDLLNRPTNAMDSVSLVREWLYNRRSELAAAMIGTNLYGYAYDIIGNRLWAADNLATNTYSANNLNQYSSIFRDSASPREPTYDADGNLTFDGVFTYAYDAENRLVSATSVAETNGAIRVLNAYDYRNRRIRKTVQRLSVTVASPPSPPVETREWQTVATHTFVWDGNNIVLERIARADGTTHVCEYFWGMDKSGTEQGAGGVEGLLAVSVDGVFYIPCYDHNGNIVRYVSETGAIAALYTYDPYGNVTETCGDLADVFSFGFSTKYHDREIGLVYYLMRFYHPPNGRWLNRDPIEEFGGYNLYVFVNNSPTYMTDALGLVVIVTHEPGKAPKDVWRDARDIGMVVTVFRHPNVRRISYNGGKIGYSVSFTPAETRMDIYFRLTATLKTFADEGEHVDCNLAYDDALGVFKTEVEKIYDCPKLADELYQKAALKLQQAERECDRCNEELDKPGGKHGH